MAWTTSRIPDLAGKRFIVTGGNAGIGFATAKALAAKRATVVIGCRNSEKAGQAIAAIRAEHPGADIEAMQIDLASFASVRAFAGRLTELPMLNVLINNAGMMMGPKAETEDGFELQFGTNVLGHHLLNGLLLPVLARTPNARIVTVSSLGHWAGRLDLDNLNAEKHYSPTHNYEQTKLANLVLAYELQRRLERAGVPVISIGVHPGITRSELGRHAGWAALALRLFGQSIEDGALPSLMAAVDRSVCGGDYIGPSGFRTFRGPPGKQPSSKTSQDKTLGAQLWQRVEAMTGISYL